MLVPVSISGLFGISPDYLLEGMPVIAQWRIAPGKERP